MASSNGASRAESRNQNRRAMIVAALDKCIRQKGVAATSLTDIALAASMSPSHVRYYFESKEEVVQRYLEDLSAEILAEIGKIERTDPDKWLEDFADYFVANPRVPTTIGVTIELFGMSVHHPKMSAVKAAHDIEIRKVLRGYFDWVGVANGMSFEEATYIAWALESGLKFNSAFQDDYSPSKARNVFISEVRRLAGLPQGAKFGVERKSGHAKRKGRSSQPR